MTNITVLNARPPNFDEIKKFFPLDNFKGAIFAYAPNIYNPSGVELPKELIEHERVHIQRQNEHEGGAKGWWDDYLNDEQFRFNEELLAHRAEYQTFLMLKQPARELRRKALKMISKRLASALYGKMCSQARAAELISEEPYNE